MLEENRCKINSRSFLCYNSLIKFRPLTFHPVGIINLVMEGKKSKYSYYYVLFLCVKYQHINNLVRLMTCRLQVYVKIFNSLNSTWVQQSFNNLINKGICQYRPAAKYNSILVRIFSQSHHAQSSLIRMLVQPAAKVIILFFPGLLIPTADSNIDCDSVSCSTFFEPEGMWS